MHNLLILIDASLSILYALDALDAFHPLMGLYAFQSVAQYFIIHYHYPDYHLFVLL